MHDAMPLVLDLARMSPEVEALQAPYATFGRPRVRQLSTPVTSRGEALYGNPYVQSRTNPTPKFATRSSEGKHVTPKPELKLLADVGLVGA
jgi:GTPase involved in cell partitioning and DNA repair